MTQARGTGTMALAQACWPRHGGTGMVARAQDDCTGTMAQAQERLHWRDGAGTMLQSQARWLTQMRGGTHNNHLGLSEALAS